MQRSHPLMRALVLVMLFSLLACQESPSFSRKPRPWDRQPFLGPIPADFRGTDDAETTKQALAALLHRIEGLMAPLGAAGKAQPSPTLALASDSLNGLPQLKACPGLSIGIGDALDNERLWMPLPSPKNLHTKLQTQAACSHLWDELGSLWPSIFAAIPAQAAMLVQGRDTSPSSCANIASKVKAPARASLALTGRSVQRGSYLADHQVPTLRFDLEAGSNAEGSMLRGESELIASLSTANMRRRLSHGGSLASYFAQNSQRLVSERVEVLRLTSYDQAGRSAAEDRTLWLSSEVSASFQDAAQIEEHSTWSLYENKLLIGEYRLHLTLSKDAESGNTVGKAVSFDLTETAATTLSWTIGADGSCLANPP